MNTKDAIKGSLDFSLFVLNQYIGDLSDAELLHRPASGCNHLAWQLGHLVVSHASLLNSVCEGRAPALPEGFEQRHSKEMSGVDDAAKFDTKRTYQNLFNQMRDATAAALDGLSDADLDRPGPERMRKMFPTVGAIFTLIAAHPLMHAGQFAVVRRQLGKPVVI
jgi:hypothetical protein